MKRFIIYISALLILGIAWAQQQQVPQRKSILGKGGAAAGRRPVGVVRDSMRPDRTLRPGAVADSLRPDSLLRPGAAPDSLGVSPDSLPAGKTRFSRLVKEKVDITGPVAFKAKDSLVMIGQQNAYLFGEGNIEYGEFKLNSQEIRMELDSSTVYASGVVDANGNLSGTPIFQQGGEQYESKSMKYNFKSQRGYITDVITEQGEGFLVGGRAKKMEDGSFFLEDGKYTTCEDHDHPHFYLQLTKGRVRPKKDVVSGPAYMVLFDVPVPIALPFGYFPFSDKYSSGIIFPTFGDDYNRGFYLRNGGYYFAINDNIDLALTGELYTKGSWGLAGRSSYVKRYRYRGSFDVSFLTTVNGDKGSADYSKMRNFQVVWSHSQDQKANPAFNFSASVNFATSGYARNDINSYYNSSFTENTKSSTVNATYRRPGSKWSFSATANVSQRTQDSTLSVSFPNLNVSMSQVTPFKRKHAVGAERWYEKIRMSYSGQFQNSLTSGQDQFLQKSLIRDWKNGIRHSIPVSATFSALNYLNISPSVSINDRMYTSKIRRQWDTQASRELQDTTYGFYNIFDFNLSLGFDTKLYGFYKPMKFLGDKVQMIRHVLTPTMSLNWSPDFGDPMWGVHDFYEYTDQAGNNRRVNYSYFNHGLFGVPGRGKNGSVSFGFANNLEMKVRDDSDSTGYRKISLIENLSLSSSYNLAADSLKLSPLQTSMMLRLTKSFNLNLSATWDPYVYRANASGYPVQINRYRWQEGLGFYKLSSTGTSFSYTLNNDTFKRKPKDDAKKNGNDPDNGEGDDENSDDFAAKVNARRNENKQDETANLAGEGYAQWDFPWSLSFNYSVSYGYGDFNAARGEYNGRFTQNLSFNGNIRPTKNWNLSFSSSYDFNLHKIAYMNCSISRDLHCFTMSASVVPFGPYKSYNFHIAAKSSLLQDLKYDKQSQTNNNIRWY